MRRSGGRALSLVPFALVLLLFVAVRAGWMAGPDRTLLLYFSPPVEWVPLAQALTWLGDSGTRIGMTLIVAVGLMLMRAWRRAVLFVAIVWSGALLNIAVKLLVMRPRPDLLPHLDAVTSSSFPSGHAANGAILYLAIALLMPARTRPLALALAGMLAVAIGLSRVALAVHWPSDVLAGWSIAIGWILLWGRYLTGRACG